jgi:hypothetical protein
LVRHGVKDASSDPACVERWWTIKPSANIGIATGDGMVVVDVDPRNGGEVDPAWPDTLTARTAGGGWHFYYTVNERLRNSNSAIAPGVDVKADAGYVVAPPSVRDGSGWCWEAVRPMTTVDASVLRGRRDIVKSVNRQSENMDIGNGRFVPLEVIPEGQRHSELARWAGWLRGQGYAEAEIGEVLAAVNASACASPLSEEELDGIVGWAGRLPG